MVRRLAFAAGMLLAPGLALLAGQPAPQQPKKDERPRLVVLVVLDQFRGDFLQRWEKLYGKGGFKRLTGEGAWFTNCHYDYAYTVTAAGHATMATGCGPDRHGIVGNEWYDRGTRAVITSVQSERYLPVPPPPPPKEKEDRLLGAAPSRRLQPSVADALKEASKGKCRVVAISIKDRSAILLAGLLADACYWFLSETGNFVTSTFYRDAPHAWVNDFNRARHADQWFGKDWTRLRADLDYTRYSGPDDGPGESKAYDQGVTFPHATTGGLKQPGRKFYDAVTCSPYGNDLLWSFARRAIDAEKLGQDDHPDLLCVSFSSNDLVGHAWGPDSHEVLDMTLRTDALIKDMLEHLDAKVGKGRYSLVLCADHGICPTPEVAKARGLDSGRIPPATVEKLAEAYLVKQFGKPSTASWIEKFHSPWFYFDRRAVEASKIPPANIEKALAKWLPTLPGIQAAYTRDQLGQGPMKDDPLGEMVRRSNYAGRSGDVTAVPRPFWMFSKYDNGTTHGAPYLYDTHVPLLVYGPGVPAGAFDKAVSPKAVAPILAHLLGVRPPAGAEAVLPKGLRK